MAIVTIGGNIGAGKTAFATKLALALGYEELVMGNIFRVMAAERGMSINEFYLFIRNDPKLEREVDKRQIKLMKEKQDLVVEGRIAWYFAKKNASPSVNILLTVDPHIGAERKMKQKSYPGKNIGEIEIMCRQREKDEQNHYRLLYGIENHLDPKHYDIALDTSFLDENEMFQKIFTQISRRS